MNRAASLLLLLFLYAAPAFAGEGNRFAYLDAFCDPYYVHGEFPKLATPQWIGEEGVEAVVVLAIDDMRDPARYEAYLRPILDRLKQIDGRAPVSIMTCKVDPQDPQLQAWLDEGLSIECHTIDHPCPLLQGSDFAKAKSTYDRCVDLMNAIPGNTPVAFRMPCCDSRNTPSPRFWTEIFNGITEQKNFLAIDSSVFCVLTSDDKALPRELVLDGDGGERFRNYIPFPSFVNTIENYPYPYLIAGRCWEFPCIVPSDWEAQNLQQPNNPKTVEDMKAALDAVVLKQGVFDLVFHPHGWIRADQVVELIDHAHQKHGRKVKFLTFREAQERLTKSLLGGRTLRDAGVKLLDLNADGWMDVIVRSESSDGMRVWSPQERAWKEGKLPSPPRAGLHFGVMGESQTMLLGFRGIGGDDRSAWRFDGEEWQPEERWTRFSSSDPFAGPPGDGVKYPGEASILRDLDGDGFCEFLESSADGPQSKVFRWDRENETWRRTDWCLPPHTSIVDKKGRDAGLRFLDIDHDGDLDLLFSNGERYSLHLFDSNETGWSIAVHDSLRAEGDAIPAIVRPDGTSNGVWFHSDHLWVQNEDTARLPDLVDRRSFAELLAPQSKSE